jgi:predicted ATPase
MLSKLRVQHYKSLFDTEVTFEPLTVFIGPNGSGKSNVCEALAVLSDFLQKVIDASLDASGTVIPLFSKSLDAISQHQKSSRSKFWQGRRDYFLFEVSQFSKLEQFSSGEDDRTALSIKFDYPSMSAFLETDNKAISQTCVRFEGVKQFLQAYYFNSTLIDSLRRVAVYDFVPFTIANESNDTKMMTGTGKGLVDELVDILHNNRQKFDELESRFAQFVPNIKRIALPRRENQIFALELIDKYSGHHIPAWDVSDGTLRILAFLAALYQENTPSIICFEEPENGIHPWLLSKIVELLKVISTEGITGKPVQVIITTHSPVLLSYVEPNQVRAVELDSEGKTQIHALPTDSVRFQKALEAYDGDLGELWFTNVFGGNPA